MAFLGSFSLMQCQPQVLSDRLIDDDNEEMPLMAFKQDHVYCPDGGAVITLGSSIQKLSMSDQRLCPLGPFSIHSLPAYTVAE